MPAPQVLTILDAVTATTTSEVVSLYGVRKASLAFKRANHSAGSTAFTVTVSVDGVTYVGYNKLITNSINSIAEGEIRVATVTLSSDTTSVVSLDLAKDVYHSMKVTATETTDGTHSCFGLFEYAPV